MNRISFEGNRQAADSSSNEIILINWIQAMTAFSDHFIRLSSLINQLQTQSESTPDKFINKGQCSMHQLMTMMNTMQKEVESLLMDFTQVNLNPEDIQEKYKKLARHTRRLSRLNQQAKVVSLLVTLVPS